LRATLDWLGRGRNSLTSVSKKKPSDVSEYRIRHGDWFETSQEVSKNSMKELMKKYPPWFTLDSHSVRFAKKLSVKQQQDKKEAEADKWREWSESSLWLSRDVFLGLWNDFIE